MREILFRGKSKKDGEWYTGSLLKENHERTNEKTEIYKIKEFNIGFLSEWTFEPTYTSGFDEEVLPDTIGQYTGLRDSKRTALYPEGQMIFEGDIVKVTDDNGEMNVCSCGIGYVLFYDGVWYIADEVNDGLYDVSKIYYIEVIGNIHDNPELLKGGEG